MRMREQSALTASTEDTNTWVEVRSLDDLAELRHGRLESSPYWWPDIGPLGDTRSFSFTHRRRCLGPINVLDIGFHDEVWVNGGEIRPHYHVALPLAMSAGMNSRFSIAAPGSVPVYRPEGQAGLSGYVGRLLAVMLDRHAVEEALADALGRSVSSPIDMQPSMRTTAQAVRSWITMVSLFTEELFRPRSIVHQPIAGMPFVDSLVRGFLLATDHSYRAALEGEATEPPPRAVRAAIDIIETEAQLPLTISALAARTYVSVRSLQQGFRAHVGTTPMAYLREVRLRRAHQQLQQSDPSVDTVASIVSRWGFSNLGRFAAAYAARYGEMPAVTLRRPGGSARTQSRRIA